MQALVLGGAAGPKNDLYFIAKISIDLGSVEPKRGPALHLQEFRGSVIVPLDDHPILHCFPFRCGDADAEP